MRTEQESPKRVLDETLGMSDNTKKNRVSFSPKSKPSSLAQQSKPPCFVNKMIVDLKKTDRDMSIEGRNVFKKHLRKFQKKIMPTLELTLQDKAGHQIDFFALGIAPTNSFRNFEYDAIVRVSGARIEQKEEKLRLIAYEGNQIELTKK